MVKLRNLYKLSSYFLYTMIILNSFFVIWHHSLWWLWYIMKLTLQWSSMKYMSIMEGITTGYSELWYNHKMSLLKEFFHVVRIGDLRRTIYDSLPIRISCMTSWSPWWWDLVCAMIQTPKKMTQSPFQLQTCMISKSTYQFEVTLFYNDPHISCILLVNKISSHENGINFFSWGITFQPNVLVKLGRARVGFRHTTSFNSWKAWCMLALQLKASFLSKAVRGTTNFP